MTSLAVKSVARFLISDQCTSVSVLTGAGFSTGAGIPDFRSAGGLYATLNAGALTVTDSDRRAIIRDPTHVVEKSMFFRNQFPYLEVRRPFILGTQQRKWSATLAHRVLELIHVKTGKLTRLYTQNIDGLDYQLSRIPPDRITPVHGSIRCVACESCGHPHDFERFCNAVRTSIKDISGTDPTAPKESRNVLCDKCRKPTVKPTTVLFGAQLPEEFFDLVETELPSTDLLIVAGTSLVVSPANSVVCRVGSACMRLIVNQEPVGESLGVDYSERATRDVFAQGDCDRVFAELAAELGWISDLEAQKDTLPPESRAVLEEVIARDPSHTDGSDP